MAAIFRGGGQAKSVKVSNGATDTQWEQKTEKAIHRVVFPLQQNCIWEAGPSVDSSHVWWLSEAYIEKPPLLPSSSSASCLSASGFLTRSL